MIRRLEHKDAAFMLEWMHDKDTILNLIDDTKSEVTLAYSTSTEGDNKNVN